VRTVVNEPPEVLQQWLERRRALGQDLHDEVWEGVYHVAPAPHPSHGYLDEELAAALRPHARAAGLVGSGPLNVGEPDDYRVPDRAYTRGQATSTFVPSVVIAVEIVSPDDETWQKLDFYYARGVEELLIADPRARTVRWLVRGDGRFEAADASAALELTAEALAAAITWPAV
jgi:Uma2 family endonuclease